MKVISEKTFQSFVNLAEHSLTGDWVLLGGALLHVLGKNIRTTTDIDLVPLDEKGNSSLTQSFNLAEKANLPIETINSAALYFLQKIPGFESELIEMKTWPKGRLLRPNLYLFIRLKVARFSESDSLDCEAMLNLNLPEGTNEQLRRIDSFLRSQKNLFKKDALERIECLIEIVQDLIRRESTTNQPVRPNHHKVKP